MNTLLFIVLQGGAPEGILGSYGSFLPLILIFVVFWLFMIRPQMKRQKELKNFRESLKKGDKIVTTGGIYGKVAEIQDIAIIMEIADGVKIKVDKAAVIKDMTDAVPSK
ncbi:preprotein translocase subunit YajC [Bacteroidia bacterium]|nr:preprotein translocase subunit YajC [Bacteroidia bacterium]